MPKKPPAPLFDVLGDGDHLVGHIRTRGAGLMYKAVVDVKPYELKGYTLEGLKQRLHRCGFKVVEHTP